MGEIKGKRNFRRKNRRNFIACFSFNQSKKEGGREREREGDNERKIKGVTQGERDGLIKGERV